MVAEHGLSAWGKSSELPGESHHLAHHSADVAAVFIELLNVPVFGARACSALGRRVDKQEEQALASLVFLHDIGKLAPGFQAKAWKEDHGLTLRSHLECGWHWLTTAKPQSLDGIAATLASWPHLEPWFAVMLAHHGRPVRPPPVTEAPTAFAMTESYDWRKEDAVLGEAMRRWFPDIGQATLPPPVPALLHYICGLVTLADWVGSDRRAFPFVATYCADYWQTAQAKAARRVAEIGLSNAPKLKGSVGWNLVSPYQTPRAAQAAMGAVPASERLILLEAETGSGKTEAALWRFVALFSAGEVDALYFAVPTRAAARQLHSRVQAALSRMFQDAPEAVLAIPGQVLAGEARGQRLPDFTTRWDDGQAKTGRWAAEHAARFLAARVAVGTVDQVALGGLQVKHAHLRGTSLSRALLVIDEVHASDAYMTEVQSHFAQSHLALGGHVLLMSATLGSAARRKWRHEVAAPLATDAGLPYPALWTSAGLHPVPPEPKAAKSVAVSAYQGWSGEAAAVLASQAAAQGARVLVIRNTVARAQETFAACKGSEALLQVAGRPTLHHSRFAVEDRALLDQAVEVAIGKDSPLGGRIVIGTQTLEQSLDLCADLLITDLCPMDVLLQRIGRLHRHRRPRPEGFHAARAVVLCPSAGLSPLIRAAENGLGAFNRADGLSGVYLDLSCLAGTLELIEARPTWTIPDMNRALVEAATHPEALAEVAARHGWQDYDQRIRGKALAEMRAAGLVTLDRGKPLAPFPDDETIRTRLGDEGVLLRLPPGTVGAFGQPIHRLALPAQWSRGLTGEEVPEVGGSPLRVTVSDVVMSYGPEGLSLLKN